MTGAARQVLAELRAMARTGRHSFTGCRVGAALASRLPRLIDGVARLIESERRAGGRIHG